MKYLIVIEESDTGFAAYSPDLDGCVATAPTREEVETVMGDAIEFHLDGLRRSGAEVPPPTSIATYVEIA